MNAFDWLDRYLARIELRLRWAALSRGAVVVAGTALAATVLLILLANSFSFSAPSVTVSRLALYVALAAALAFGIAVPLLRLNRKRAAHRAENEFTDFGQRLVTFAERSQSAGRDPFLELLAEDTWEVARHREPRTLFSAPRIAALLSGAAAGVAVLVWLVTSGPGFWGHGASLLWAGDAREGALPFYDISVQPGDHVVRRRGDQLIGAQLSGFQAERVRLLARYKGTSKWETAAMQPSQKGVGYEFLFAGLAETVDYQVEAGGVRSKTHTLTVIDLPAVKQIRVTYHYPKWFASEVSVEEQGGDLRAVEGTEAELEIRTDRLLREGVIVFDEGDPIPLTRRDGTWVHARVPINKDGLYHVAAVEQGQRVRLTEDFFIEARADQAPHIAVKRPGRDARVNPIEEVTVEVEASDDFGVQEMNLHYSVNGGAEKIVPLLSRKGQEEARGETLITLEDFKLQPGDVVSLYASARDARNRKETDIYFIEAQPFEKEYRQAQAMDGGGGGGGEEQDQNRISARQKEIIAATWNQLKDRNKDRKQAAEDAKFLADTQTKLRDQAASLAKRMRAREITGTNQEFQSFAKDMETAGEAMKLAVEKLRAISWKDALPHEQKALQYLLRAEATFRQIQVAFGSRGGGGGGGGGMGRDLENLFDLELDTEKNQYETGRQQSSAEQRARDIDEALQRLEQLARRQQELAQQQSQNRQNFQQRWQQEMLRRELEQLQRQMEQLTRGDSSQSQQSQSGQQSGQQQGQNSAQQAGQGQQGQSQSQQSRNQSRRGGQGQNQTDPRLERALEHVRQATKDMERASQAQGSGSQQSEAEARRAAERLQEARDLLRRLRGQESSDQVSDLAGRSEKLAEQQRDFASRLKELFPTQPGANPTVPRGMTPQDLERARRMADEKQKMAEELTGLERDMQDAVRDLAGTQRDVATRLRDALGDMQKAQLGIRMKYGAEAIRQGYGPMQSTLREPSLTTDMERLRDQLRQAREMAGRGREGQSESERALARLERLREQLGNLTRQPGQQGQQGQQGRPGQQQGGQQQGGQQQGGQQQGGQQGGQQQGGQQQGGQQQGGQRGQGSDRGFGPQGGDPRGRVQGGVRGGMWDHQAMNTGDLRPGAPGPVTSAFDPNALDRSYRDGMRDLMGLRRTLEEDPRMAADLDALLRDMRRLDPSKFPGNPELVERIRTQLLPQLEHVELQLRRQLDEKGSDQVKSAATERIPAGYADAVAEYFRKLSRGK